MREQRQRVDRLRQEDRTEAYRALYCGMTSLMSATRNNQCVIQNAMEAELFQKDVGAHVGESDIGDHHGVLASPSTSSGSKAISRHINALEAFPL